MIQLSIISGQLLFTMNAVNLGRRERGSGVGGYFKSFPDTCHIWNPWPVGCKPSVLTIQPWLMSRKWSIIYTKNSNFAHNACS